MKIIQVNAWLGHLLHPLIDFIKEEDPDILCTQEILDCKQTNSLFDNMNTFTKLEELFDNSFFSPTFGFQALGEKTELGNAIFSKNKITNQQTIFTNGQYIENHTIANYGINMRNAQICDVQTPAGQIQIINHHGFHDLNPMGTEKSIDCMQKLIDHIQPLKQPTIFCGDLNLLPASKPIKIIEDSLPLKNLSAQYDIKTTLSDAFRVKGLEVVCDYVFVSEDISVRKFSASNKVVSDHKALILDFDI